MKIDDSIKFIEFVIKEVYWEGIINIAEAKRQLKEVLRQLKLAKVDIVKQEIVALENLIEEKKDFLKEVK